MPSKLKALVRNWGGGEYEARTMARMKRSLLAVVQVSATVAAWKYVESLGGYWTLLFQPVAFALLLGTSAWWRRGCRSMMECRSSHILQVGLGIGTAALVGLGILATVLNPELWQTLAEAREWKRIFEPLSIILQVVPFAAAATFGSILHGFLSTSSPWEKGISTAVAVVGATSAALLPLLSVWMAYAIFNLASLGS